MREETLARRQELLELWVREGALPFESRLPQCLFGDTQPATTNIG